MSVLRKVFCKPAPSVEISTKIAVGRIPGRATQGRRPDFPVQIVPAMWCGIGCGIIEASCVIGVAITAPCTAEMKKIIVLDKKKRTRQKRLSVIVSQRSSLELAS